MTGKLRLDLDQLQVESFDTAAHPGARGTVHGRYVSVYTIDCSGCNTGASRAPATASARNASTARTRLTRRACATAATKNPACRAWSASRAGATPIARGTCVC